MRIRLLAAFVLGMLLASLPAWTLDAFPKVGEYEVLRGDFHMHTVRSDGKLTARQRIEGQRERGIDAIAITDHGNFLATRFEMQYAPTLGMAPVRGLETGLPGGLKYHLVALGFDPYYAPKDCHRWSPTPGAKTAYYQDEMKKLRNSGGLLVLAHPAKDSLIDPILWGIDQGIIQGVEVHNGRTFIPHAFDWALKYNLAVFADSDAHGNPASDYTLVLVKEKSQKGIMDAIHARRTIALYDGVFWGRQDMLSKLVDAMLKVGLESDNGVGYVVFKNTGPVAMKGVVVGTSEQQVEIPANSKARVQWSGGDTISVRWDNAFVTSADKLTSKFTVKR